MARIRSVHPGLFTDDAFMGLTAHAAIMIMGIWTECDDHGLFQWKPRTLRAKILPAAAIEGDVLLAELVTSGFIKQVADGTLGAVRNFGKWQRPQKPCFVYDFPDDLRDYCGFGSNSDAEQERLRRRKWEEQGGKCFYCSASITFYSKRYNSLQIDHKTPKDRGGDDSDGNLCASCRRCNAEKSNRTTDEYLSERFGATTDAKTAFAKPMEEGGGRVGKENKRKKDTPVADAPEFLEFWRIYLPISRLGDSKQAAAKAHAKVLARGASSQTVNSGAERFVARHKHERTDRQYTPMAAKWLNNACWENEPGPPKRSPGSGPVYVDTGPTVTL